MDTLIIIDPQGNLTEHSLEKGNYLIGEGPECDLKLPIKDVTIQLENQVDFWRTQASCKSKYLSGNWGKKNKESSLFKYLDYQFIFLVQTQINQRTIRDWDFSQFPRKFQEKTYPQELLNFLLNIIGADQGAILHLRQRELQVLACKDVKLRDQSEVFLKRILENEEDRPLIKMNFHTHTLLFKAGLTPIDFYLIQYPLRDQEKVVLYLPKTKSLGELPQGLMIALLNLSTGVLINHLLYQQNQKLKKRPVHIEFDFFWGQTPIMHSLKQYVDKLTKTNLSILINGETGSGKEMLVNYIKNKAKATKVVAVNCAAIPKELAESYLFGHRKGSFTGASEHQMGKIQEADGGILFLDEIGELNLEIQAKLLRAIQENKITPLGGKEIPVKFWPICATHRDLEKMIEKGTFREDLFFRINEAQVKIPSLYERKEDIPFLVEHLLEQIIEANDLDDIAISPEVIEFLTQRPWKGNVRQLKSSLRRMVFLSDGPEITMDSIQLQGKIEGNSPAQVSLYPDDLQEAKRIFVESHIEKLLRRFEGNKTKAAQAMGITPRNLYRLLPERTGEQATLS